MGPKQDLVAANLEKTVALESQVGRLEQTASELLRAGIAAGQDRQTLREELAQDRQSLKEILAQMMQKFEQMDQRMIDLGKKPPDLLQISPESSIAKDPGKAPVNPTPVIARRQGDGILPLPSLLLPNANIALSSPQIFTDGKLNSPHSSNSPMVVAGKRYELPMFEGQDPDDWVYRVERCFERNHTPEEDKLSLVFACMTGDAIPWLKLTQDREDLSCWRAFKEQFLIRYKASFGADPFGQLLNLKHTGTVKEYRVQFEKWSSELPETPMSALETMFVNGLKRNVRAKLLNSRTVGLNDMFKMAQLIENLEAEEKEYNNSLKITNPSAITYGSVTSSSYGSPNRNTAIVPFNESEIQPARKSVDDQSLSSSSEAKKTVNPCRFCGERWFSGHRCKTQQRLRLMEIEPEVQGSHDVLIDAEPEEVLAIRHGPKNGEPELLVRWKGLPSFEDSWELMLDIVERFPSFHLEDKVSHLQGSIDKIANSQSIMSKRKRPDRNKNEEKSG